MWFAITMMTLLPDTARDQKDSPQDVPPRLVCPTSPSREVRLAEARALTKLGVGYLREKRYGLAREQISKALEICKEVMGEDDPVTAWHQNLLGCLCLWSGDHGAAERHLTQAVDTYRKALGENHSFCVEAMNNLAGLYVKTGDYTNAKPLLCQLLELHKKQRGEDHLLVAVSLTNLGVLSMKMGNYPDAVSQLRQGLGIYRKRCGDKHPNSTNTLDLLGQVHTMSGDYSAAESYFREAVEIHEANCPASNASLSQALAHYARLLRRMDRPKEADEMQRRSTAIRETEDDDESGKSSSLPHQNDEKGKP